MNSPVLTGRDTTFKTGYVGLGSFDDPGRIDHVRLWSDDTYAGEFVGFGSATGGRPSAP